MENAEILEGWHDAYVMIGTSAAALIGLIFVATSLHIDEIVNNHSYRVRALHNSYALLFTLFEAIVLLSPQPLARVAALVIIGNVAMLWFPVRNAYLYNYKTPEIGREGGWVITRISTFIVAFGAGALGGALLLSHPDDGLYLITASNAVLLIIVTLNAWTLLVRIGERKPARRTKRAR